MDPMHLTLSNDLILNNSPKKCSRMKEKKEQPENGKTEQLDTWKESGDGQYLTTNHGVKINHTDDSLKAGDRVTVYMSPLKNGQPGGSLLGVVLPSGKMLGARLDRLRSNE